MKPLSKEASAALSALMAIGPTAADEARVRKNLERALGVGIPTATMAVATTAKAASVAGGLTAIGVAAKAVVFVLAVGLSSVMTVKVTHTFLSRGGAAGGEGVKIFPAAAAKPTKAELPPSPVEAVIEAAIEAAPEPTAVAVVAAPEVQLLPPAPVRPSPPRPVAVVNPAPEPLAAVAQPEPDELTAPPPPPPAPLTEATVELEIEIEANFPNCDAATEMSSAQGARKLLNADRAEEAVWLLSAYQRRCPSGRWSDQAWTVRMAGLCRLHRNDEVSGLLQWFSTEYPARRAAVLSELRTFCPAEVLRHGEPSGD